MSRIAHSVRLVELFDQSGKFSVHIEDEEKNVYAFCVDQARRNALCDAFPGIGKYGHDGHITFASLEALGFHFTPLPSKLPVYPPPDRRQPPNYSNSSEEFGSQEHSEVMDAILGRGNY